MSLADLFYCFEQREDGKWIVAVPVTQDNYLSVEWREFDSKTDACRFAAAHQAERSLRETERIREERSRSSPQGWAVMQYMNQPLKRKVLSSQEVRQAMS